MKKKKILLFGGSGFLGSTLLTYLKLYDVISPTHKEVDVLNIEEVYKLIDAIQPDSIIYTAGVTKIDAAEKQKELAFTINEKIPKLIAKFIVHTKTHFNYISTDAVFDGYKNRYLFHENDKPLAKSTYGMSKLAGEQAVLSSDANITIVRLITLFGIDYGRPNFLTKLLTDLKNNKKVNGIIDQIQNPLCVDIAAKAISFIIENELKGIYHLGSTDWNSNYYFVSRFANIFGFDSSLIEKISFVDFMENKPGYRKKKSVLLCEKFNKISNNTMLRTIDQSFTYLYNRDFYSKK